MLGNILKVKKIKNNAILPKRATEGSAGMDLYACIENPLTLRAGEKCIVGTGISIALEDKNMVGLIFARSGLSVKNGVTLSNGVVVIDSDYRGEISVGLINLSNNDYEIKPNERIAQLIIMPIINPEIISVDTLDETTRAEGGFGSTGRS